MGPRCRVSWGGEQCQEPSRQRYLASLLLTCEGLSDCQHTTMSFVPSNEVVESPAPLAETLHRSPLLNRNFNERSGDSTTLPASPASGSFEPLTPPGVTWHSSVSAPDVTGALRPHAEHRHPLRRDSSTNFPQVIPPKRENRTLVSTALSVLSQLR
jgi:hypothetical protein